MPERRNWKRHAAELAVIVIGVLIALATDGWNDDRLERRTEATYLERLAADVRSDTATLAFVIRLSERKDAALQRVDRVLYQDQRASIDTLAFINDVVVGAVFASAWPFVTEAPLRIFSRLAIWHSFETRNFVARSLHTICLPSGPMSALEVVESILRPCPQPCPVQELQPQRGGSH